MGLTLLFGIFYCGIVLEQSLKFSKTATALLGAFASWFFLFWFYPNGPLEQHLLGHLGKISEVILFLLAALTLVEVMDGNRAFSVLDPVFINLKSLPRIWALSGFCFLLSAFIDNVSSVLVVLYLSKTYFNSTRLRWHLAGILIIASNAGGAWSPVGDITTTMLWIGGQTSAFELIRWLFLPSLMALLIPLIFFSIQWKSIQKIETQTPASIPYKPTDLRALLVFIMGILGFLTVPLFRYLFHIPPYLGMFFSLSIVWIATEFMGRRTSEPSYSVGEALRNIDTPSILFFTGILLMVSALEYSGLLHRWANVLQTWSSSKHVLAAVFGLVSALIDNVPLVAATQGMYDTVQLPLNHPFWLNLALSTGIGGSILIIGSAAGVAAMGLERIPFGWYLKRVSIWALCGFVAALFTLFLELTFK